MEEKLRLCGFLGLAAAILPPLFLLWQLQESPGGEPDQISLAARICWMVIAQGLGLLVAAFFGRRILRDLTGSFQRLCGVIASIAGMPRALSEGPGKQDEITLLAAGLQAMISAIEKDRQTLLDSNIALALANENFAEANVDLESANARVRQFAEQAGTANAAKRTFLAVMSHEIRTPVNGIIGMTELALKTRLDRTQRDYLETINNTAESLLDLLNEVLDFSKIEAGKLELEVTDFSLRSAVGDAVSGFAARCHSKGLNLVLDIAPDVPDSLIGDPYRLRQILVNLLSNAFRFTDSGEVSVDVQVENPGEVETRLRFSVTDTGCGIPRAQQKVIFALFTQGDSSTTRRYGGSGLGLTISTQLAQMMDGEISVLSEPGAGSRFAFTAVLGVGIQHTQPDTFPLRGRRTLLVEPHPRACEITARMLSAFGSEVECARSATEAISILANPHRAPFDFTFIDTFYRRSEWTLIASLATHSNHRMGRLVMMTPATLAGAESGEFPEGATRMTKPIREAKLLEALLSHPDSTKNGKGGVSTDANETPHGRKLNVLIAEDNATNQRITRTYLEAWGHTVTAAHNGSEAIRLFTTEPFDLILMDLQMPRMDGIAATASIRQVERAGSRVPIIALTANVLKGVREECHAAGMCGYLAKPVREHALLAAIESAVPGLAAIPAPRGLLPTFASESCENGGGPFHPGDLLTSVNRSHVTLNGLLGDCRDGDLPELFAQLEGALAAKDLLGAQRAAHAIKGVIGVFHAPLAYEAASRLERSAREGDEGVLGSQLAELRQAVSDLLTALEIFVTSSPLLERAA